MPSSRRRASARAALALVAAALTLLGASSATQAATNPISISVKVGYSGFVKAQQWMPVTINLSNQGQDVSGTLEVTAATGGGQNGQPFESVIYQTPVSLPAGATKNLRTYLVEDQVPSTVSVRLVANGRVLASADSPASQPATQLIGVLSDQNTALDGFSAIHPGSIAANVVHLTLEDVGDSAILLRAFDLLVIDDFATDTLTAAQRSAITDYVQNGGDLLLGTGASWRKTLAGVSSDILPMQIGGTTTLSPASALDLLARVEVATGSLNGGAHAWLSGGNQPLLAERFVGGGLVTLATFDWNQEPIASWGGVNPLLRQILVRTVFASAASQTANFGGPFGSAGTSTTERSSGLSQALSNLPALDLPSLVVIGLLVLTYVVLVGPINYFALRALHRRALAWVTVPLIAVVASAGAFGTGVFTKGRSVQTNQVSIIHLQTGWDRAYQESYTGILTPTRGDYQVTVSGAPLLIAPTTSYSGGNNTDLIRVGSNNSVVLPSMTAYTLRGFATEGLINAPQLTGSASLSNGKLHGTIRNLSSLPFTDAVVLAGDGFQILPTLAPGATATFDVTPKVSSMLTGQPAYMSIYPTSYFYGGGPPRSQSADADREAFEKMIILSLVSGSNYGFSPAITPMVVAWSKQAAQDVTVAGGKPRATNETAVVLPLQVTGIGAGAVPAGMVLSRFTDINGDTQPAQPGAVLMQNGTVSYDFAPALAPGSHLDSASIDSTYAGGKGVPGGGLTQTLQAKVWDWQRSAWIPMSYNSGGVTSVPPAAINPASGEVKLEVDAGGTQAVFGQVSLTGTVK
jgi:hypothetical protein